MAKKKIGLYILLLLFILLVSLFLYYLWYRYHYVSTDALFVQADRLVYVSFPKVNGRIVKLYKAEGEMVKEGELLAELEAKDYQAKVKELEEQIRRLTAERASLGENKSKVEKEITLKIEQTQRQIEALREREKAKLAQLEALKARLSLIAKDKERLTNLYKEGLISQRDLEAKETEEKELRHQIESLSSEKRALRDEIKALEKNLLLLQNERHTVKSLSAQMEALGYLRKEAEMRKSEADLYLSYTKLISPLSGVIAKKFRSEGDVVGPGEPIYALVDPESFYVLVLLEETKLSGVIKGAKARIKLDAYPRELWEGEVEEILPASAATFALVPRDISAGEFTKLAQRIPIRIKILKGNKNLLRVGLGGEVEIKRVR
uniref:HlyD family efflux transporter periplasmic adaptor subunit n=1 Tax=Caldimicrobium thiodismutans TaxID=1653476 RepID=A0A832GP69_9BACT